jgi:hypothetical protein
MKSRHRLEEVVMPAKGHPKGFEEEQVSYETEDPRKLIGQFRRLGSAGPAYQIMAVDPDGTVHVELVYNDEKLKFPMAEVLEDPIAETIP